jgi:hypothetical protein
MYLSSPVPLASKPGWYADVLSLLCTGIHASVLRQVAALCQCDFRHYVQVSLLTGSTIVMPNCTLQQAFSETEQEFSGNLSLLEYVCDPKDAVTKRGDALMENWGGASQRKR